MDLRLSSVLVVVCGLDGPDGLCPALTLWPKAAILWGLFRLTGHVHLFLHWCEYNVQVAHANETMLTDDGLFGSSKAQS